MRSRPDARRLLLVLHRAGAGRSTGPLLARPPRWAAWAGFLTMVVWTNPEAAGHRLRAVGRLWAWQLWRRLVRRPVEVTVAAGWRLRLPTWSVLAGVTVAAGRHEPDEQRFADAWLRPGEALVDVGANVGAYTVAAAVRGARVVAFEPSTRARAALAANVELNGVEEAVWVRSEALGARRATAALTTGLDAGNRLVEPDGPSSGPEGPGLEPVEVRRLDELRPEIEAWLAGRAVSLVKVDAEGHDLEVLEGAAGLLGRHRPVVVVEAWHGGVELRRRLSAAGYRVHRFDAGTAGLTEVAEGWAGDGNLVAVPREREPEVRRRLAESPSAAPALPRVRWWPRAGRPPAPATVHLAGLVPAGASGVTDYARGVGEVLLGAGLAVTEGLVPVDGRSLRAAVTGANRLLRIARSLPPGAAVLWNYSSFAYGYRGIPLHGVLFGLGGRLRHHRVVTVLHELAYPRGRRGWRGAVQSATQWLALGPVLLGSHAVVVTTEARARQAAGFRRPFRRPVHVLPVFSTLGVPDGRTGPRAEAGGPPVVGILKYTGDGARPDVVVRAVAGLPDDLRPRVVLLGAPGPAAPEVAPWHRAAEAAGLAGRLEFTGVVPVAELSRLLLASDVVVIPNDEGPSGRHTSVAAALAHGRATVALDGPERWPALVEEGALVAVAPEPAALSEVLAGLLRSDEDRTALGTRGRRFYERHLAVERTAAAIADLLVPGGARPQIPRQLPSR